MGACPACAKESPEGSRFCPFCGLKLPEPARDRGDPLIGRVIDGKYAVVDRIGSGAMGNIYKAEHKALAKVVALKVLHRHLVREESHIKRFHREARAASRLSHPNCITVLDFGQTNDGFFYIAMEYLPGRDLNRILFEEGPLAPERAVHIATQVLDALDEAHSNGVIHRDLKPENIMIEKLRSDPDFVKVLDFGIAKIQDFSGQNRDSSFKTATGMVFGTPEYMSPEQIRGEELDGRSDLYSLGVVLYQVLSGVLPFQGESVLEVATAHLSQQPVPLRERRRDLPPALCAVVERLMAKRREDRYENAMAVKAALVQALAATQKPEVVARPEPLSPAFTRTTTKIPKSELESDQDQVPPTTILSEPPIFPTTASKRRLTTFKRLLLVMLILASSAALTFVIVNMFTSSP